VEARGASLTGVTVLEGPDKVRRRTRSKISQTRQRTTGVEEASGRGHVYGRPAERQAIVRTSCPKAAMTTSF